MVTEQNTKRQKKLWISFSFKFRTGDNFYTLAESSAYASIKLTTTHFFKIFQSLLTKDVFAVKILIRKLYRMNYKVKSKITQNIYGIASLVEFAAGIDFFFRFVLLITSEA